MTAGVGHRLTISEVLEIRRRYEAGENSQRLAPVFGVSDVSIRNAVRRAGGKINNARDCHRTCTLNESVFDDPLSDNAAYWAGMLITDGYVCVDKNSSPSVNLTLHWDDHAHVFAFRDFLVANHTVRKRKSKKTGNYSAAFGVRSPMLTAKLHALGVTVRKSRTATPADMLRFNRHFWRGCIDGDGEVDVHRDTHCPEVDFCGSENMVTAFIDYCHTVAPNYIVPIKYDRIYHCDLHGEGAQQVLREIYQEHDFSLRRKSDAAAEIRKLYDHRKFRVLSRRKI